MLRRRWPIVPFVGWTAFVWLTRISNAWQDAAASTAVKAGATVLSLSFLVLAGVAVAVTVRAKDRAMTAGEANVYRALAAWTVVVWIVRGVQISLADYAADPNIANPTGFKIVHLVLGVVSIVLAALTSRVGARELAGADPTGAGGAGGDGPVTVSPPVAADR
jgi:hypothetical protein